MLRYWIIDIVGSFLLYFFIGLGVYHFWYKDKSSVDKKPEKDYTEQRQEKTYNRDSFEYKHKDSFYFEKEK